MIFGNQDIDVSIAQAKMDGSMQAGQKVLGS